MLEEVSASNSSNVTNVTTLSPILTSDPMCVGPPQISKDFARPCLIANMQLGSNNLQGALSGDAGTNPFIRGALAFIQELDISNNSLSGALLGSLDGLPRLKKLHVDHNHFEYGMTPEVVLKACSAPFGLECTGIPQESCSAFDEVS